MTKSEFNGVQYVLSLTGTRDGLSWRGRVLGSIGHVAASVVSRGFLGKGTVCLHSVNNMDM